MTNRPMSSQIGVDPMERKKTCKNKKKTLHNFNPFLSALLCFQREIHEQGFISGSKGNVHNSALYEVTTRVQLANCPWNYQCVKRVKHEYVAILPTTFFNSFAYSSLQKEKEKTNQNKHTIQLH